MKYQCCYASIVEFNELSDKHFNVNYVACCGKKNLFLFIYDGVFMKLINKILILKLKKRSIYKASLL